MYLKDGRRLVYTALLGSRVLSVGGGRGCLGDETNLAVALLFDMFDDFESQKKIEPY